MGAKPTKTVPTSPDPVDEMINSYTKAFIQKYCVVERDVMCENIGMLVSAYLNYLYTNMSQTILESRIGYNRRNALKILLMNMKSYYVLVSADWPYTIENCPTTGHDFPVGIIGLKLNTFPEQRFRAENKCMAAAPIIEKNDSAV